MPLILHLQNKNPIEKVSTNPEETEHVKEEDRNVDLDVAINDLISADKISINEKNELNPTESKEADEDPRRKRRRSSASS